MARVVGSDPMSIGEVADWLIGVLDGANGVTLEPRQLDGGRVLFEMTPEGPSRETRVVLRIEVSPGS